MAEEPISPTKLCPKCGCVKPATAEHFGSNKRLKYGLACWCRACVRSEAKRQRALNPNYHREYYRRNRERLLAYFREHARDVRFGARREETLSYWAEYRAKNRDRVREVQDRSRRQRQKEKNKYYREFYASHPAERQRRYAVIEQWRRDNRERARCYVRNRRAAIRGNGGKHTKEDIDALWVLQNGRCAYCDQTLTKYHVDHKVPVTRGGSSDPDNLALACPPCNHRKSDKTPEEFLAAM